MWTPDPADFITADMKAAEQRAGMLAAYKSAFDARLDEVAQEKLYDNRLTIVGYQGSANPQWAAEAQAFVDWRDIEAMPYLFGELAAAEGGGEVPTLEEFIAGIPAIEWPEV